MVFAKASRSKNGRKMPHTTPSTAKSSSGPTSMARSASIRRLEHDVAAADA